MLTLKRCYDAINHKLGVDDDEPLDRLAIVNAAGSILYAHPWRWLEARRWTLTIPANADRICLPEELAQLSDVIAADSIGLCAVYVRDYGDLLRVKARAPTTSGSEVILAPYNALNDYGQVAPHLAFWPTFKTSVVNGLVAFGSARWVDMRDREDAVIPLPIHLPLVETLFLEIVRAYAAGWSRDGVTDVQAEIARIQSGPTWLAATNADTRAFQYAEQPRNTAVGMARGYVEPSYEVRLT